jgi:hypothetical protein
MGALFVYVWVCGWGGGRQKAKKKADPFGIDLFPS